MPNLDAMPTMFRGVFWDAGWEFDAPCVMYSPVFRYGMGGNSGRFDGMVEDVCCDLSMGHIPRREFCESDLKEFKWRGWSPLGFAKRKNAWHITIQVAWYRDECGELQYELRKRTETWGVNPYP